MCKFGDYSQGPFSFHLFPLDGMKGLDRIGAEGPELGGAILDAQPLKYVQHTVA
jgi:hypothetical protein